MCSMARQPGGGELTVTGRRCGGGHRGSIGRRPAATGVGDELSVTRRRGELTWRRQPVIGGGWMMDQGGRRCSHGARVVDGGSRRWPDMVVHEEALQWICLVVVLRVILVPTVCDRGTA
jgi:hypothetical protein